MHCSPYAKKMCEDDIECLRIRRCFNGKAYADRSLKEWYVTIRKNRGQSETGPGDITEQSAVSNYARRQLNHFILLIEKIFFSISMLFRAFSPSPFSVFRSPP